MVINKEKKHYTNKENGHLEKKKIFKNTYLHLIYNLPISHSSELRITLKLSKSLLKNLILCTFNFLKSKL